MAQYRRSLPRCPTPIINKVRRSFAGYMEKPKAVYFRKAGMYFMQHFILTKITIFMLGPVECISDGVFCDG